MQKCGAKTGSADGKVRGAPQGGKGKPTHGTNGGIVPPEFVAATAGGACAKLALSLLKGPKLPVSRKPNARYELRDAYRVLLAVCCRPYAPAKGTSPARAGGAGGTACRGRQKADRAQPDVGDHTRRAARIRAEAVRRHADPSYGAPGGAGGCGVP